MSIQHFRPCAIRMQALSTRVTRQYAKLFSDDAIRMPPGAGPEYGAEQIQKAEQAGYDAAKWNVKITPRDVLPIEGEWIFGIGDVEVSIAPHADGKTSDVRLTRAWLLQRQPSGEWLIKRQMWNAKPDRS